MLTMNSEGFKVFTVFLLIGDNIKLIFGLTEKLT